MTVRPKNGVIGQFKHKPVRLTIVHQMTLKMMQRHVLRDITVTKHVPVHVKLTAHGVDGHNGIKANVRHMIVHQAKQKMT